MVGGLRELPKTKLTSIPRMADFAHFGEAVSRGMGNEHDKFLNIYRDNRKAANESALEDSPVAAAIRELVATGKWSGTVTELKDELESRVNKKIADSAQWPKSPRGMSGVLRRLASSLRQVGICVEFSDRKKNVKCVITIYQLETTGNQQSSRLPQSPSEASPFSLKAYEGDRMGDHSVTVDNKVLDVHATVDDRSIPTVTQQSPRRSPMQTATQNRVAAAGDRDDCDDRQNRILSNGHTENRGRCSKYDGDR